jgi:hypothetical protein
MGRERADKIRHLRLEWQQFATRIRPVLLELDARLDTSAYECRAWLAEQFAEGADAA